MQVIENLKVKEKLYIEKLENDFIQLLNDMPLYWNGNSGYIDMLWI